MEILKVILGTVVGVLGGAYLIYILVGWIAGMIQLRRIFTLREWIYLDYKYHAVDPEIRKNVPPGCWECEELGFCRDRTRRDKRGYWKCRRGCLLLKK